MGIESLVEIGAALTQFLQTNLPSLRLIMGGIDFFTEPEIVFLLFIAIYWGQDRDRGSSYLHLFGCVLVIFSTLSHLLQFPAPFWLNGQLMQSSTGGFSAPNLNTAVALLMLLPFKRLMRPDLALPTFFLVSLLAAISQIYLGVAGIADTFLGFLLGTVIILLWQGWIKRYGHRFAARILGQRFWIAILLPAVYGAGYLMLINWVQTTGYSGYPNVDPQRYWRAWQTSYINSIIALAILGGIGIGIAVETAKVRFRPNTNSVSLIVNWVLGFACLAGLLYFLRTFLPTITILENDSSLAFALIAFKYTVLSITITYFIPWLFTLIGTASSEAVAVPTISLNNFSMRRPRNSV